MHAYIYIYGAHDCCKTRIIRQPPASVCLSGVVSPWRKNDPGHRKHERCYFLFRPFRPQADANGAAAAPAQAPAPAGDTAAGAGAPTAEGGEKKLSKVYTRRLRSCCSNRASILLYIRRILCSLLQMCSDMQGVLRLVSCSRVHSLIPVLDQVSPCLRRVYIYVLVALMRLLCSGAAVRTAIRLPLFVCGAVVIRRTP